MTKSRRLTKGDSFVVITNDDPKFLGIKDGGVGINEALERGKACLGCRKRKMRCDGKRPICSPCLRRNREDDCEYAGDSSKENNGLTRMQRLENDVTRLQNRVRELESSNPTPSNSTAPPPSSHNVPDLVPDHADSASSIDSAADTPRTVEQNFPYGNEASARMTPPTPTFEPEPQWWEREHPPDDIANMLICLFLPNSTQLGFALNNARFLQSLTEDPVSPNYPHQGLMNAIFLWALRLSNDPNLLRHERIYLRRACSALSSAPSSFEDTVNPMRILHRIQAEILVSLYLYCRERLLEGRNHNNAAVTLACSYGLNQLFPDFGYGDQSPRSPSLIARSLPPPHSWVEFGERLNVFWALFNIDRSWMVLGPPMLMTDDPLMNGHVIDSPWPYDMLEYERADLNGEVLSFTRTGRTVERFIRGEAHVPGEIGTSSTALRAKSSAVFGRAQRLRAWIQHREPSPLPYPLDKALSNLRVVALQYATTLTKPEDLESAYDSSDARRTVFMAHAVAYTAVIIINSVWVDAGEEDAMDACINAGHECSRGPEHTNTDLNLLDPMLFFTGIEMAKIYKIILDHTMQSEQTIESQTRLQLLKMLTDRLRRAQSRGTSCPVYGMHLTNITEVLEATHI